RAPSEGRSVRLRIEVGALLLALPALGQEKPAPPAETPTFTVGVDLVAVDVNVVDDRGNPYRGLGPDDFKVTVDGKPRRLVTVDDVDLSPDARKDRLAPH